jgi:hypothetical protein
MMAFCAASSAGIFDSTPLCTSSQGPTLVARHVFDTDFEP